WTVSAFASLAPQESEYSRRVSKPVFSESLLQRYVAVATSDGKRLVHYMLSILSHLSIVDIEGNIRMHSPISGLERSVTLIEISCNIEILIEQKLSRVSKNFV